MSSPTRSISPDALFLSALEFSQMMLDSNMPQRASEVFHNNPTITVALRHYHHMTLTIRNLERELERQNVEQQQMFGHLMGSRLFRQYVEPLVADYRRQLLRRNRRARSSPYSRTPSPIDTPSNDSSTNPPSTPPSNVEIIPEQQ